jgi:hypothetical protein
MLSSYQCLRGLAKLQNLLEDRRVRHFPEKNNSSILHTARLARDIKNQCCSSRSTAEQQKRQQDIIRTSKGIRQLKVVAGSAIILQMDRVGKGEEADCVVSTQGLGAYGICRWNEWLRIGGH